MLLYDGNGNQITVGLDDKSVTPTKTNFMDEDVTNLFDNAEFLGNKRWADNRWYDDTEVVAYEIPINGIGTYYTNIMARTSNYNDTTKGRLLVLDAEKNVLDNVNLLPTVLTGHDSTGIGIYDTKGIFEITNESAKYLRLCKTSTMMPENPNINTEGYDFLEVEKHFLKLTDNYDITRLAKQLSTGIMKNIDNSIDSKILEQVGKPNNLYGRRVYMIGDSNMDNWNSANRELFENRYGCTVTSFASYGATFEVTEEEDNTTTARHSAIGQWNLLLQKEPIDQEALMLPEDIAIFFMMGTNCSNKGTTTDRDNVNIQTALGAMEWLFTQVSYYCRGDIPVGVILPVQSGVGHENIIWSAERHGFPYIDIEKHCRQIQDNVNGSIKPESFIVTGNHIATHGWKHFRRIVHNWMAYQV